MTPYSKCQGINHEKIERHENTGHLRIVNMDEFYSQVGSSSPAAIFFFVCFEYFVVRCFQFDSIPRIARAICPRLAASMSSGTFWPFVT
jgi:hypothetical protein